MRAIQSQSRLMQKNDHVLFDRLSPSQSLFPPFGCYTLNAFLFSCFFCRNRFHPLCGAVRSAEVLNEGGEGTGLGADMAILCETHVEQASGGG